MRYSFNLKQSVTLCTSVNEAAYTSLLRPEGDINLQKHGYFFPLFMSKAHAFVEFNLCPACFHETGEIQRVVSACWRL